MRRTIFEKRKRIFAIPEKERKDLPKTFRSKSDNKIIHVGNVYNFQWTSALNYFTQLFSAGCVRFMEVKISVRGTMKITTPTQELSSLHVTFKTIELHGLSVR